ncbi:extracellular solute-binding protein [Neorhizobium sp. Rsf11]|uniref:Extracellular solute-binding protein n=2 Tax=Neorhizobium TaxID=1525371 RepID=A0ABV0MAM2_9HYPH|nr:extracellular solute-binding protein [Neorhizobium petrolearium]MCC2611751.1 extracellular solute-binding protein [Neorhizobium petrolearium]WGI66921.1 extracellular solute-binding protein [Neorhizobium petrolearium]
MAIIRTHGIRRFKVAALGAAALMASAAVAAAESVITWMYVEAQPNVIDVWRGIAEQFEKDHPGVKIEMKFLENQAFKAKIPTLLQSSEAPSMFYTWGGGVLKAQAQTGMLRDVTGALDADGGAWRNTINAAAVDALTFDDNVWAAPFRTGVVAFYYNKELFQKAGVDASTIKTWGNFTDAVKKLKAAGITPIAGGGGDKWPLHFYWSYLAMRQAGHQGFVDAKAGKGDGFASEPFVKAGEYLAELGKLEPFQNGYLGATWNDALAAFGDGRAAIILSFENTPGTQAVNSTSGKGLPVENIGRFPFPALDGAPGVVTDNFGGINGWTITKNAPPETEEFLKYFSSPDVQRKLARDAKILPVAKGASDAVSDPLLKVAAEAIANETWHQNFLDQDLGPNVGAVVNDMSVAIVSGQQSPADAAQQIQDAFSLENP